MKWVMTTFWQLLMKKESIRMINSQRSNTEKITLVEKGKKIGIDKAIKQNEFINKSKI